MVQPGKFLLHAALTLALLGILGLVGGAVVVIGGLYNVAAIHQHTPPVYKLLDFALHRSIQVRTGAVIRPVPEAEGRYEQGFRIYRDKCVQCHGAPGVPRADIGQGMLPLPNDLVQTAREHSAEYAYWVVANGIRMTGMPAWRFRLDERALWAVVDFVESLPALSPKGYAALERTLGGGAAGLPAAAPGRCCGPDGNAP
ncbi:c-type cytochrome [Methylomagnum sp.]